MTGPTGSGKTTTLYAGLRALATEDRNVTSIEDPIEMVFEEFNQLAVHPRIGITFASALRHILRQDPDVIMVGEIRDPETAQNAIQAALTGHLVLSTLHTNDSVEAITRLQDLEIEPFLISSTLVGVVAQRLVRIICAECKVEDRIDQDQHRLLGLKDLDTRELVVHRGTGCTRCRGTGYFGRTPVLEMFEVTDTVADLVGGPRGARRSARKPSREGCGRSARPPSSR